MKISSLKIGVRLEIQMLNSRGEGIGPTYVSQLLQIIDDSNIIIASPIYKSVEVPISSGVHIEVFALHEMHGLLKFKGTIKNTLKKVNLSLILLRVDSEIKKIQRRKYYRLDCYIDVLYQVAEFDNQGTEITGENHQFKKAITKNISASGISIVVEENIKKDTFIQLRFAIQNTQVNTLCKVMRTTRIDNAISEKYDLGMCFIKMAQPHREFIIKYIFDQQRELLKKNLLDK